MAPLTGFPTELLVKIFQNLDCIDEVHHLRRTCRRFYSILDSGNEKSQSNETFYTTIMRAIITNSPVHRYDIRLSKVLHLHQIIVHHHQQDGPPLSPYATCPLLSPRSVAEVLKECLLVQPGDLDDTCVWDIIVRWESVKQLGKLYLSTLFNPVEKSYLNPWTFEDSGSMNFTSWLRNLLYTKYEDNQEPARQPWEHDFDQDQRVRFHIALTCYWLLNEYRWCLSHITFQSILRERGNIKARFHTMLQDDEKIYGARTLVDELDLLEIFEFLSHHLIPKHSGVFESIRGPHSLQMTGVMNEDNRRNWRLVLRDASAFLQPPDIMELVLWSKTRSCCEDYMDPWYPTFLESVLPCRTYVPGDVTASSLGRIGVSQLWTGDAHYLYLKRRVITLLEQRCNPKLNITGIEEAFEKFWASEVRGRMFWWAQSESKAVAKIDKWKEVEISKDLAKNLVISTPTDVD